MITLTQNYCTGYSRVYKTGIRQAAGRDNKHTQEYNIVDRMEWLVICNVGLV